MGALKGRWADTGKLELIRLPNNLEKQNLFRLTAEPKKEQEVIVFPLVSAMASPPSNSCWDQEQIAASHEFDGVRKEKERLTAAKKKKKKKKKKVPALIPLL